MRFNYSIVLRIATLLPVPMCVTIDLNAANATAHGSTISPTAPPDGVGTLVSSLAQGVPLPAQGARALVPSPAQGARALVHPSAGGIAYVAANGGDRDALLSDRPIIPLSPNCIQTRRI